MFSSIRKWSLAIMASGMASQPLLVAAESKTGPIKEPVFNCKAMSADENFVNFESGQVRPLALSKNGKFLFVANTPANCLEIYRVKGKKLRRVSAITVGSEPVAVAVNKKNEVWVVNHMSDSVSVVSIKGKPRVVRTLLVGDEPRDIVFAGKKSGRAFITSAYRGQNHLNYDIQDFREPGIGRADVWVYDVDNMGEGLSGSPLTILSLFSDTPRALTASPDGSKVYAAAFHSGNQTTAISAQVVDAPKAGPNDSLDGVIAPETGLIVKFNGDKWVDELNQDYTSKVLFNLPDEDVFVIDANASIPVEIDSYSHVGTVLFNMAVNPVTGTVYVSNTDARNDVRFEGPGIRGTTLRGHTTENRITVLKGGNVYPQRLNTHVDFGLPMGEAIPASEKAKSLAQPMGMVVTRDGQTLYTAAFGSGKIVKIDTAGLERGQYIPDAQKQIKVPGGPSGIVISKNERFLYVYSRFDNVISVINTRRNQVVNKIKLYNPEPENIKKGRPFMYDANLTSSNGTGSCSSCHIFSDNDSLAWDLGNPDGVMTGNLLEESSGNLAPLKSDKFHPLKGPMTTQTFRGMSLSGAMHWRGDKMGLNPVMIGGLLEGQASAAFKEFNPAFVELVGREEELTEEEMQHFTDFALSIVSYPNPIRQLDDSLTERQIEGRELYMNFESDGGVSSCDSCHKLDRSQNFFGTDTLITGEGSFISQDFKIPHLRNMYQKVGMFGSSIHRATGGDISFMGDQIRGFGYAHDGSLANLDDFILSTSTFIFDSDDQVHKIMEFVMAFDTELFPIVGQQVTLSIDNSEHASERADLLVERAIEKECDLVIQGTLYGSDFSGVLQDNGFVASQWLPPLNERELRKYAQSKNNEMTYTCLAPGTGDIYGI